MNAGSPLFILQNLSSLDISNQNVKFERKSKVSSIWMELPYAQKLI